MALDTGLGGGTWVYGNGTAPEGGLYNRAKYTGDWSTVGGLPDWSQYGSMMGEANQNFLRSRGYTGDFPMGEGGEYSPSGQGNTLADWANQNGITIGRSEPKDWGNGQSNYLYSMFDTASGKPIGTPNAVGNTDTMVGLLSPVLMAAAGPLAAAYGGGAAGAAYAGGTLGATKGALNTFESGGNALENIGKGAATGAAAGGIGGAFGTGQGQYDLGGAMNVTDPNYVNFINKSAGTLGNAALTGKNPTQGMVGNLANLAWGMASPGTTGDKGMASSIYDNPTFTMPQAGQDSFGQPTGWGETSPSPSGGYNFPAMDFSGNGQSSSLDAVKKLLIGGQGGFNNSILGGLTAAYLNNQQQKSVGSQINGLQGLYGQDSPYAQTLRNQLARRDAAAGRRSQYGPREVELQAALAGAAAKSAPQLQSLYNQQNANRNLMVSSLINNKALADVFNKVPGAVSNGMNSLADWWNTDKNYNTAADQALQGSNNMWTNPQDNGYYDSNSELFGGPGG